MKKDDRTVLSAKQLRELISAVVQSIPTDLLALDAQYWIGKKTLLAKKISELLRQTKDVAKAIWVKLPVGISPATAIKLFEAFSSGKITSESIGDYSAQIEGLQRFYSDVFKKEVDLSSAFIHEKPKDSQWLMAVLEGLTREELFGKCKNRFSSKAWKLYDDLNTQIVEAPRNTSQTYFKWFRGGQEADEENKNKSADACRGEGMDIITLEERLLLELWYHWNTGQHLDLKTVTITSSRDADGNVVIVHWGGIDDRLRVNSFSPRNAYPDWRARSAV